jgi:metal-dependent amidase/aminoacylase/carboxypeptidase family protein
MDGSSGSALFPPPGLDADITALESEMVATRRSLHSRPELSFEEVDTGGSCTLSVYIATFEHARPHTSTPLLATVARCIARMNCGL